MKGSKTILLLAILLVIALVSGYHSLPSAQSKTVPAQSTLSGYLPLETFKYQFNEVSSLTIKNMQLLQNDSVTTSYLYSFNSDIALSLIVENSTDSVIKVILITTLDPENRPFMESVVYACDPNLTGDERAQVIARLVQSPDFTKDKDSTVIQNQVMYRLQEYSPYVKLSAEPI